MRQAFLLEVNLWAVRTVEALKSSEMLETLWFTTAHTSIATAKS
jgi:hypothetical protein